MRQKIYKTIWHAHERSPSTKKQLDDTEKAQKRSQLTRLIKSIENEYRISAKKLSNQLDISPGAERTGTAAAGIRPEEENRRYVSDSIMESDKRPEHQHKRSWLGTSILTIILLVITLFVIWSLYNSLTGTDRLAKNRPASIAPLRQSAHNQNGWIQVFDPVNITSLDGNSTNTQ